MNQSNSSNQFDEQSNKYSFKSVKYWCHNCSKQFTKMIDSQNQQEVTCPTCNNVSEEINHMQNDPRTFVPFSNDHSNQNNSNSHTHAHENPRNHTFIIHHTIFLPAPHFIFINQNSNHQNEIPFLDQNLLNFINFLIANNNGQQENSNPPADKKVVATLKEVLIDEKIEKEWENKECAVCQEHFKTQEIGKELKCDHLFHKDCIEKWLDLHRTCPCCRKEVV